MTERILVVDDDADIRDLLCLVLGREGFVPLAAADGAAALRLARAKAPALVVLDIGMPEMDGYEVCRALRRRSGVPVLFLSARADEIDRVLGFELGADDFVPKPFSPRELVARIRAILRRGAGGQAGQLVRGALTLDPEHHVCAFDGREVRLTASEMALLERLMARPDRVCTRAQCAEALYGAAAASASDRTVDSHLRNLRRKLAEAGCAGGLETLHGIGIRLGPCEPG